jgi:probable phosphoglycerate mutase
MEVSRRIATARTPRPDARQQTTLLLIRHAHTGAVGEYLAGRSEGVPLSARGRAEAAELRTSLHGRVIHAIYSSPLERAMDTARGLALDRHIDVRVRADLVEVDFGEWTGKTFLELDRLPGWQRYNRTRSIAHVPRGENASAVRMRITRALADLHRAHPGQSVAVVTHAEVIRTAVLHYLGTSLDLFHQVEIAPASVTTVALRGERAQVVAVNASHVPSGLGP